MNINVSPVPQSPEPTKESDRRIAPRVKMLKRGKIFFNNMSSTFDCIVRNASASGALLTLDESAHLPHEFLVRIGDEKGSRPARLVYRRGALAGIRFLDVAAHEDTLTLPFTEDLRPALDTSIKVVGVIRRIIPEQLPSAVESGFRWTQRGGSIERP